VKLKIILPLFVVLFAIASEYSGLDIALARPFYDAETQSWPLKDNWYTAGALHSFGKDLVVYAMMVILALFAGSFVQPWLRAYRKGAGYLLLGSLLGPAIVAVMKASTHIYSPWDLTLFGGDKPYIRLFDRVPAGLPIGHAFPGGHSSGGFAFLAWFFLLSFYKPEYRFFGLALGLGLGGIFAATQEVRGAHFLSHDLFSLVICWYVGLAVFHVMYRKQLATGQLAHS
jgi:membrane-associated PAP2 superfamily phosphatase